MNSLDKRVQAVIKAKTKKGGEWNKLLEQEANRLYDLIFLEMTRYYQSYTPKMYNRTMQFYESLRIRVSGNSFEIYFDPRLAMKKSLFPAKGGGNKQVFVPTLLDAGWFYSGKSYHFTYYEGYHFIENAVKEFKRTTPLPIQINIESRYYPDYYASIG